MKLEYSPKLRKVMAEIKAILIKNDIAGIIVIHEPGFSEFLHKINPGYSCAKFVPGGVRFKAKAIDFNGDKEKLRERLTDTSNMLMHLSEGTGRAFSLLYEMSNTFDKITEAEHGKGNISSEEQKSN